MTEGAPITAEPSPPPPKRLFIPALVIGWAVIAFGVWSALRNSTDAGPLSLALIVVGFDVLHDLLIAPLLFLGAWLVARFLPPRFRGPVRAAGAVTMLVVAFSFPLVLGLGRRPTNSSTLPLDYGRNVGLIVLGVWALAGATVAARYARARRA